MVQLLRIIAVGVVVIAGVVLASVRWPIPHLRLGVWSDHTTEIFLNAPSAVERFNDRKGDETPDTQDKDPPLVREAKALAEILNPRMAPAAAQTGSQPKLPPGRTIGPAIPAKFKVIGISYLPSDPKNSFAYIQVLPGDTFMWVRQGSEVGHQTVKEIKSSSIVCSDGPRTNEMPVELPVDTASILESGGASPAVAAPGLPSPIPATGASLRSELVNRAIAAIRPSTPSHLSPQEEEGVVDLARRIKELQNGARAGGDDSNTVVPDANVISQMIADFKASRVSPEEANKLDDLGKQLNGTKESPGAVKRREILQRANLPRSSKE